MIKQGRLWLVVPLAVAVALVGCGTRSKQTPASLSGKVTYNGKPVTGGTMTFLSKDKGGTYTGAILADGSYTAGQLPIGELTVTIETESVNRDKQTPDYQGKKVMMSPPPQGVKPGGSDLVYVKIPAKYADPNKTDLKVTVSAGKNTHNFDLKD